MSQEKKSLNREEEDTSNGILNYTQRKPSSLPLQQINKKFSGSLYLFDRRALRYFRKDGHLWKKKKDGRTVREAHEKLKSGNLDVLHCYYAHGEEDDNFQRRCYWLLDGVKEHIVLVHYRDVSEDTSPCIPQVFSTLPIIQSAQTSSVAGPAHISSTFVNPLSYASSTRNIDLNKEVASSEFEDPAGDDLSGVPLVEPVHGLGFQVASSPKKSITEPLLAHTGFVLHPYTASSMNTISLNRSVDAFVSNQVTSQNLIPIEGQNVHGTSHAAGAVGFQFNHDNSPSCHNLKQKLNGTEEQNVWLQQPTCTADLHSTEQIDKGIDLMLRDIFGSLSESDSPPFIVDDIIQVDEEYAADANHPIGNDVASNDYIQTHNMSPEHQSNLAPPSHSNEHAEEFPSVYNEFGNLQELDSFERWMSEELGNDCNDSLMALYSYPFWNTIDSENVKAFSSMSRPMQLDVDSVTPSLSHEQLFSIDHFSPDWGFSGAETEVLISGFFLGGIQPSGIKWCCMFGEVEVSAEVVTRNAIRCQAPPHSPGRVPFYITCGNRLACSEVREFEYRENLPGTAISESLKAESEDEMHLQIQFAKMLSLGSNKKRLLCSIENCSKCTVKKSLAHMLIDDESGWEKIEKEAKICKGYLVNHRDALLQKLLKGRLYEWLVCKLHEDGKGPNILDDKGHGVIHFAAALGYEWAMASIIAAGVNPNFRDARGRTALHWAAYYGREQTIVTLLLLGASPGAIEDPTSKFPTGQTAADLASSSGHKGIAGYLAEADLNSYLTSMSITDSISTSLTAEDASETVEVQNFISSDVQNGQISPRESLAALRNSTQIAARIHAAFTAESPHQRQLTGNAKESDATCDVMLHACLSKEFHMIGHFNDYLHIYATKIQKKYRGWKTRKEFMKIRNRIVKIQAHVRGHQVRKQYKKVVWSVGIVEKIILRWRRKGPGLRGFRAEKTTGGAEQELEMADEYDFLSFGRKQKAAGIEKALSRVKSMVRSPEAREQYRRLMASSSKSKAKPVSISSNQFDSSNEENLVEKDPFASFD